MVVSVGPVLPSIRNQPVSTIDVVFSKAIDATSFGLEDLTLTRNGGSNLLDQNVTITPLSDREFRIGGLDSLTAAEGEYVLCVTASGIRDTGGTSGIGSNEARWTMDTTVPTVTSIENLATNPRNTVVMKLDVTFSEPIDPSTFDWHDLTLTRDGGSNLITSDVQIVQITSTTYSIRNFNWVVGQEGTYSLTVDATGIQDLAGNAGTGTASETWVMDTTAPAAPTGLAISPDRGVSATDGLTNTTQLVISGTVLESGLRIRVSDTTNGADLGVATSGQARPALLVTVSLGGIFAPDGALTAILSIDYGKSFKPVLVKSTSFVLDVAPPAGNVSANPSKLVADGKGGSPKGRFHSYGGSEIAGLKNWALNVLDPGGRTVESFDGAWPPSPAIWDGDGAGAGVGGAGVDAGYGAGAGDRVRSGGGAREGGGGDGEDGAGGGAGEDGVDRRPTEHVARSRENGRFLRQTADGIMMGVKGIVMLPNLPEFLEETDGEVRVSGHRIGLYHVLREYNEGSDPAQIALRFPTLKLATVYKIIAFYLDNQPAVDAYLNEYRQAAEGLALKASAGPSLAELQNRLEQIRLKAHHAAHVSH